MNKFIKSLIVIVSLISFFSCMKGPKGDMICLSRNEVVIGSDGGDAFVMAKGDTDLEFISMPLDNGQWEHLLESVIVEGGVKDI